MHGSSQLGLLSGRKHSGSSSGGNQKAAKRVSTVAGRGGASPGGGAQAGGGPVGAPEPRPHAQLLPVGAGPDTLLLASAGASGFARHGGGGTVGGGMGQGIGQSMGLGLEMQMLTAAASPQLPASYAPTFSQGGYLRWTPRLSERFVWAVNKHGGLDKALPKAVYNTMNVSGIALTQVDGRLKYVI